MLGGRIRHSLGVSSSSGALRRNVVAPNPIRKPLKPYAMDSFRNFMDNLKGGKGGGGQGDSGKGSLQDVFNRQNMFGSGNKARDEGPMRGGPGGGPGGGGWGGGGGGGFGDSGGEEKPEKTIMQEILEVLKYSWIVLCNLGIFLLFADILHRSLDWCCQVELLLLVGASQQAFERVAGCFFSFIEGFQKNVLGWDVPGDEDTMPMYQNLALYYPEAHAYTYDQYRFPMTEDEKVKFKHVYALRHYERFDGHKGDVDMAEIDAIKRKYDPVSADRRDFQRAKEQGRIEDYWDAHRHEYERMVGERFVRPPGAKPPVDAGAAGAAP